MTEPLFRTRVPGPPLDTAVEVIWYFRGGSAPSGLERILPSGCAQLIVNLAEDQTRAYATEAPHTVTINPGTVLAGVSSRHAIIDSAETEHVAGVTFRPGGLASLVRLPADETRDVDIPLDTLWGRATTMELRDRLLGARSAECVLGTLESFLLRHWRADAVHPAVAYALEVFTRRPHLSRIDAVSQSVGLSQRHFIERFTRQVGVTPKRFCRLRRFQRAAALIHREGQVDWAQVALDGGYFDQAHFSHEFREFSGLTPGRYLAQRGPFQNHVKILQSDATAGLRG